MWIHNSAVLLACSAILCCSSTLVAADDLQGLRAELAGIRADYENRINQLEGRIRELERQSATAAAPKPAQVNANAFNPAISLILDGGFSAYREEPGAWSIPGVPLGGEAGLAEEGLSLGHSELSMSANIDPLFYGKLTLAVADHDGETELELEEAFFQTMGLGAGTSLRGGRFLSAVGYLNQQHDHAMDFVDVPLVYAALFGNKYVDDGLRFSWVAPTDLFVELGAEVLRGSRFPGGGEAEGAAARAVFANVGGDIGDSHSWQLGASHLRRTISDRSALETLAHAHADVEPHEDVGAGDLVFDGDGRTSGLNLVYRWAPGGNRLNRQFKLQAEYFSQRESGLLSAFTDDGETATTLRGKLRGYYVQSTLRFARQWQAGLRFEALDPDNRGGDLELLEEAGLLALGFHPRRTSLMLEWLHSEFSRIRLQYNRDEAGRSEDGQLLIHYTFSLGDHQAHPF